MKIIVSLAVLLLCAAGAAAQVTDLQTHTFDLPERGAKPASRLGAGWELRRGGGDRLNMLDVSFAGCTQLSTWTYSTVGAGAAWLGAGGADDYTDRGRVRHVSGFLIHAMPGRHFTARGRRQLYNLSYWAPVSVGVYGYGNGKKALTVNNLIVGLAAGVSLNLRLGAALLQPYAAAGITGGYTERYRGGVFYSNLNSGGAGPSALLRLGAALGWHRLRLMGDYTRYGGDSRNPAAEAVAVRLNSAW